MPAPTSKEILFKEAVDELKQRKDCLEEIIERLVISSEELDNALDIIKPICADDIIALEELEESLPPDTSITEVITTINNAMGDCLLMRLDTDTLESKSTEIKSLIHYLGQYVCLEE